MVTPADGAIFQFEHRVDRELGRIMLVPAYAATIHKSQGSEYPAVIIPVLTQHYAMLQRNLASNVENVALVCGPRGCVRTAPVYRRYGYGVRRYGYGVRRGYAYHRGYRRY